MAAHYLKFPRTVAGLFSAFLLCTGAHAQTKYDLLLRNGHLIDPKNKINKVTDIALRDGKVAEVGPKLDPKQALKAVDLHGLYVTPGLIDIHAHVYGSTGEAKSYAGDNSLFPDGYTFRVGVTTVADAGCAGYKNFEDFKMHVIDRVKTRVFAFINIVGAGMRGSKYEDNLQDMEVAPAAEMAKKYKDVIVGVKTAHYTGPEWTPVEHAVEVGKAANIPVMVDFGSNRPERPITVLLREKLRPGDIYTHCFSGLRNEMVDGHINQGMIDGRKRGVYFDVGHGGGSFLWPVAMAAMHDKFYPDSISTDIHVGSMNAGMKDMLNIMSKFVAMGETMDQVVEQSTWHPAREIKHEELGQLSVGAIADIAVLNMEKGTFGFTDMYGAKLTAKQNLKCEMTIKGGRVVYDLNGLSRDEWTTLPNGYKPAGDPRWDGLNPVRRAPAH